MNVESVDTPTSVDGAHGSG